MFKCPSRQSFFEFCRSSCPDLFVGTVHLVTLPKNIHATVQLTLQLLMAEAISHVSLHCPLQRGRLDPRKLNSPTLKMRYPLPALTIVEILQLCSQQQINFI